MTTIDVVDLTLPDAGARFAQTLHDTGFAVVKNHSIPHELVEKVYEDWGTFFHSDNKNEHPFKEETHAGYISSELSETAKGNTVRDLKEFFHYYQWGPCPDHLREQTDVLMNHLLELATRLLSFVQNGLTENIRNALSMPLGQMLDNSKRHLFRIIHYPPLTGNEPKDAVRAAEHADINLITLLPAATAEGLQAKTRDGQWLDVPIDSNWIIINAGDMLQECTQHYYPSTLHRVTNPTGEAAKTSRLSMPLFFHPESSVRLSEKHTAASYLLERWREIGLADEKTKIRTG